jgi:hypothetical protein
MKRNARSSFSNPFSAWMDFASQFSEMSLASAQVIAHRTSRMATAGPLPGARDRKEFALMGQEKFEAAAASGRGMAAHMTTMNLRLGAQAFRQLVTGSAAFASLAMSRDIGQYMTRQAKLVETLTRSTLSALEWSDSTARLAGHGLEPLHRRATANARRLARR